LGQTGILTGPLGEVIKTFLSGATAVFDDVARRGGVHGRRIRLESLDDKLEPPLALANYRKLLEERKVFAFFGCVGSGPTAAASEVLRSSGAPLVGAYAVADSARAKVQGSAYFVRATTGREAQVLLDHLSTLGLTRIGVAQLDNPGGQEALALIAQAMAPHRLKPAVEAAVKGDGSNIDACAAKLADPQLQAVVMYLGGTLPANLIKAIRARGSSPKFYGMSIVPGELSAKVLGDQVRGLAISQVVPYPWSPVDPTAVAYRKLMERQKLPLGYYTYEGYLNAQLMVQALERAGRELTRARLHTALQSLRATLGGMTVDFSGGSHTGSRFVELVAVTHGGRFVR
jgi:ABC-type branched-subunit amino acid transport system substrate-binding protein